MPKPASRRLTLITPGELAALTDDELAKLAAYSHGQFRGLKKYDDAWKVLDNPTVVQNMKAEMGNKYSQFKERMQTMNQVEVNGDEIFSQGGVEGLYTIMEGAFALNTKTGRVQVALPDDGTLDIWGAASTSELSVGMRKYIEDLQARIDQTGNEKAQVSFETPNQSTIQSKPATKTKVKKHVSTASPSGTYERESQWEGATLQIVN